MTERKELIAELRYVADWAQHHLDKAKIINGAIVMLKAVESIADDADRYRWLTTIGGGIGMRLAEVEREWNGCDGVEGFNAALARCAARRTP